MTDQQTQKMPRPNTDLDFQAQLTDPYTSSEFVAPAFANKFREFAQIRDEKGNIVLDENGIPRLTITKDLWGILQLFNRDWRLGNINRNEEAIYIRHNINLATDILNLLGDDFKHASLLCISRALCVNETSQAKNGFLRRMLNTFIHKTNTTTNNSVNKRGGLFKSFAGKNNKY